MGKDNRDNRIIDAEFVDLTPSNTDTFTPIIKPFPVRAKKVKKDKVVSRQNNRGSREGRLDILTERLATRYVENLEREMGLNGLSTLLNPHIKRVSKRIPKRDDGVDFLIGLLKGC